MGVNLGPVRLVKDLNGQMNIIGDGINVAQRVMSFSRPGQLLVSRSFYEVVSCLSRDYANLFRHEGSRTDKHVREHEVYAVVGATPAPRRVDEAEARSESTPPGAAGWLSGTGPLGLRRSALVAAPLAFPPDRRRRRRRARADARRHRGQAQPAAAAGAADPLGQPGRAAAGSRCPGRRRRRGRDRGAAARRRSRSSRARRRSPRRRRRPPKAPGRLELAVAPWGEVLVDGKSRGLSPPLRVLEIPPGPHTVEIRNSTFPAHVARVEVKPGEAVKIQHRFR